MLHNQSRFKLRSIGIAAENLTVGKTTLEVIPIEINAHLDGEVSEHTSIVSYSSTDADGNAFSASVEISNAITAEWYPDQSNSIYPPNIERGEYIELWQYAEGDIWYWVARNTERHLRRLETKGFLISATPTNVTVHDKTNSYLIELSAHKRLITLSTSKVNGEKCTYLVQFDLEDGSFLLLDEFGNELSLDSEAQEWLMKTASEAFISLKKRTLTAEFDDINLTGKTGTFDIANLTMKGTQFNHSYTNFTFKGAGTFTNAIDFNGTIYHLGVSIGKGHTHTSSTPGFPTGIVLPTGG